VNFLAVECCPRSIVAALRRAGHDVLYALEDVEGASDAELASLAQRLERVLITEDFDFGELVVRHHVRLPGLVILALFDQTREARQRRVLEVVDQTGEALRGYITVIEAGRERRRPIHEG
jgi:predicted nuclease of predicted toxin-antitoxin system